MLSIRRGMDEYVLTKKVILDTDGRVSGEMMEEYNLLLKKLTLAGSLTMFGLCAASVLLSIGLSYIGFSKLGITVAALSVFFTYFCGGCTLGMFASGIWNMSPVYIPIGLILGPVLVGAVLGSFLFGTMIGMLIAAPLIGPIIGSVQIGNQGKPLVNAVLKGTQHSVNMDGNSVSYDFTNPSKSHKESLKKEAGDSSSETVSNQPKVIFNAPMFKGPLIGSMEARNDGAPLVKCVIKSNVAKALIKDNTAKTSFDKSVSEDMKEISKEANKGKEIAKSILPQEKSEEPNKTNDKSKSESAKSDNDNLDI